jgi:hypothetical protein
MSSGKRQQRDEATDGKVHAESRPCCAHLDVLADRVGSSIHELEIHGVEFRTGMVLTALGEG